MTAALSTPKLLVTGPFGAGKTTLIATVSDTDVLDTEQRVTDETGVVKERTTVAMDHGRVALPDGTSLQLFGTPGQRRFSFMWEILARGMLGYVVVLDAQRPETLGEAHDILATFRQLSPAPFVIALNRCDELAPADEADLRTGLAVSEDIPVLACQATSRESAKQVLLTLLTHAVATLDTRTALPIR